MRQQAVVGVEVVHVVGGNDLVGGEDGRRHGLAREKIESQLEQAVAVLLREVGDRGDQTGTGAAQLGASFGLGVLADDGAFGGASTGSADSSRR